MPSVLSGGIQSALYLLIIRLIVALIAFIQLRATNQKEVEH